MDNPDKIHLIAILLCRAGIPNPKPEDMVKVARDNDCGPKTMQVAECCSKQIRAAWDGLQAEFGQMKLF